MYRSDTRSVSSRRRSRGREEGEGRGNHRDAEIVVFSFLLIPSHALVNCPREISLLARVGVRRENPA